MYLKGFQVILSFFPQNHTFWTILNLLICISNNDLKKIKKFKNVAGVCKKNMVLTYGNKQKVTDMSETYAFLKESKQCWLCKYFSNSKS